MPSKQPVRKGSAGSHASRGAGVAGEAKGVLDTGERPGSGAERRGAEGQGLQEVNHSKSSVCRTGVG